MAQFTKYVPTLLRVESRIPPNWKGMTLDRLFAYSKRYGWTVDSGGPTQCGVTLAAYRAHFGQDKTRADLQDIEFADWVAVMKGDYWDRLRADQIKNQSVAELMVDWAINSGLGVIRKIQDIVSADVDGIVGPVTLNCINAYRAKCLHCRVKEVREDYYRRLVVAKPSSGKYLEGWLRRLSHFEFQP